MLRNHGWIEFNYINKTHSPKLVRLFYCDLSNELGSFTIQSSLIFSISLMGKIVLLYLLPTH